MSTAWAKGSTRAWRKIRAAVLKRDQHVCQLRIPGICRGRADCAHHTIGRAVSGDDMRFIVAACTPCNLHIGQPGRPVGRRKARTRPRTVYNRW